MSTVAVLLLCIQACLVQDVFGRCGSSAGVIPVAPISAIAPSACGATLSSPTYTPSSFSFAPAAAYSSVGAIGSGYGGIGEGNVALTGELPIAGNTAIAGQVPIMGIVSFSGAVPAAGVVSISGQSVCDCSSMY